jgi:hypothetical protein
MKRAALRGPLTYRGLYLVYACPVCRRDALTGSREFAGRGSRHPMKGTQSLYIREALGQNKPESPYTLPTCGAGNSAPSGASGCEADLRSEGRVTPAWLHDVQTRTCTALPAPDGSVLPPMQYRYGSDGQRAVKFNERTRQQTLYFNNMWQVSGMKLFI